MGERLEDLMKSVLEDIKNQEYKQAYLFFGEEGYLKKQYRNKLLQACVRITEFITSPMHLPHGREVLQRVMW